MPKFTRPGTEAELCSRFIEAMSPEWTAYPESCGFDIVLRRDGSPSRGWRFAHHGDLLGVEAKLRPSFEVVEQVLRKRGAATGPSGSPHFLAVLVPKASKAFIRICTELRINVVQLSLIDGHWRRELPLSFRTRPTRLIQPPPVVPSGPAGVPSPRPLTPWRVAALRIVQRGLVRGELTNDDFKEFGVKKGRWVQAGWIVKTGQRGRKHVYELNPGAPGFPTNGFEEDFEALKRHDRGDWGARA